MRAETAYIVLVRSNGARTWEPVSPLYTDELKALQNAADIEDKGLGLARVVSFDTAAVRAPLFLEAE